jgi:hypothetical protein
MWLIPRYLTLFIRIGKSWLTMNADKEQYCIQMRYGITYKLRIKVEDRQDLNT